MSKRRPETRVDRLQKQTDLDDAFGEDHHYVVPHEEQRILTEREPQTDTFKEQPFRVHIKSYTAQECNTPNDVLLGKRVVWKQLNERTRNKLLDVYDLQDFHTMPYEEGKELFGKQDMLEKIEASKKEIDLNVFRDVSMQAEDVSELYRSRQAMEAAVNGQHQDVRRLRNRSVVLNAMEVEE